MATDTSVRRAGGASSSREPRSAEPASPRRGPAVWLRRLVGVREDILDWAPEERTRYTWYGTLVCNTALLGAVSLGAALTSSQAGLPLAVVILVAGIWFWFVLALESWLVSTSHGMATRSLRLLLPQLVLSALLSLCMAQPLLLQIFDREIRQEIAMTNARTVADYRNLLVSCNPSDGGDTSARPRCAAHQLLVDGSPAEPHAQLTAVTARTRTLQSQVDGLHATLRERTATEQRACAPDRWVWQNGVAQVSQACERARADTAAYRTTSGIATYEKELAALVAKKRTLADRVDEATGTYKAALSRSIDARTLRMAAALDDDGLLTRADALATVVRTDGYAAFLTGLVHLVLMAGALPGAARYVSGPSSYDRLLAAHSEASRRLHAEELDVQRSRAALEHEAQQHRVTQEIAERMARLEHRHHLARKERAAEFRAELDARTARLLQDDA
ncbi:DUF4407 domain-containing protein [Streptomyces sp. NPDC057623]|uniref:DUF4407 domain-containing protein n=1 Tax=Streptomyces sp. NPDC057623 TaxID=3346187 RepID=UPI00368E95B7